MAVSTGQPVTDRRAPKYEVLAAALEQRVRSMKAHDALPTERELLEEFGVSRTTVRQAIQLLIRKGLVYNVQGSGTYVSNPAVVSKTLRLTGFSEDMRQRGMEPASTVLEHGTVVASPDLAAKLHISAGDPLVAIRRLRSADGVPMALETVYLVAGLVDRDRIDLVKSLYEQLRDQGVNVVRAAQTIEAVNVDAEQAHRLDQAVGAAALRVQRVSFTDRGIPFEHAETIYRGDRYSFDVVVARDL
jgi:DNA-binding GntR family transcriptional regulator